MFVIAHVSSTKMIELSNFFNNLKKLWQELYLFNQYQWNDPADVKNYHKIVTKERTYDFFAGLQLTRNDARARVLGIKPLPHIDEIFVEIRHEEKCWKVMLGSFPLLCPLTL